jgi:hypothetical protein
MTGSFSCLSSEAIVASSPTYSQGTIYTKKS